MKRKEDTKKDEVITIRCTKEEKVTIQENAAKQKMTMSKYLINEGLTFTKMHQIQKLMPDRIECCTLINEVYHVVCKSGNKELQKQVEALIKRMEKK